MSDIMELCVIMGLLSSL